VSGANGAKNEKYFSDPYFLSCDISTTLGASAAVWCAPRSAAQAAGVLIRSGGGPVEPQPQGCAAPHADTAIRKLLARKEQP
jgi:hypothetical protein